MVIGNKLINNKNKLIKLNKEILETILYENSSGGLGNITLKQSVANFSRVKIEYCEHWEGSLDRFTTKEFPVINGRISNASLELIASNYAQDGLLLWSKSVSISGTSLTLQKILKITAKASGNTLDTNTEYIAITKIIGIK